MSAPAHVICGEVGAPRPPSASASLPLLLLLPPHSCSVAVGASAGERCAVAGVRCGGAPPRRGRCSDCNAPLNQNTCVTGGLVGATGDGGPESESEGDAAAVAVAVVAHRVRFEEEGERQMDSSKSHESTRAVDVAAEGEVVTSKVARAPELPAAAATSGWTVAGISTACLIARVYTFHGGREGMWNRTGQACEGLGGRKGHGERAR